ncbi:hypothetical protein B0H16DRAFT_1461303 [Mycena metata]|uniref:Uncharacterized protein n=1 Tax=Mycena metata TaxID=1033252 RepID=A0AAD7IT37_9AGAR|nr:hypothetical protein B0H16DRAFT_1461303 [Mycena metata]
MRRFHALLAELHLPAFLGRLPGLMGIPAGGSLTADQWLVAAVIVCPILVPQIWAEYMPDDVSEVLSRRIPGIKASITEKREKAAAGRKRKAAAAALLKEAQPVAAPPAPATAGGAVTVAPQANTRSQRTRRKTQRATHMDVDPEAEAMPDAGAVLNSDDDGEYQDADPSGSRKRQRRREDGDDSDEEEEREARAPPNLHPDDPVNFCKLATSVKLLLAHPIRDAQIDEADDLLRSYLPELMTLYGESVIKPNHHYATHTAENVRDYGPLQEFWTFLFERINKVLKSYNSSNHSGGELETSFFREFHRTVQTSRILAHAANSPAGSPMHQSAESMYRATADDRGTIQALARQLDKAQEDGGIDFQLSAKFSVGAISDIAFAQALSALRICLPLLNIRPSITLPNPIHAVSVPLFNQMNRFPFAILSNRRYYASQHSKTPYDSYVLVRTHAIPNVTEWAGELQEIFVVDQPQIGIHRYGFVRWFVPENALIRDTVWET